MLREDRQQVLEELVDGEFPLVLRLLTRLTGSITDAEDIAQDVFAGLARSWRRLPTERERRLYVLKATYNGWREWGRRRSRAPNPLHLPECLPADAPSPSEVVAKQEEAARVRRALARLPDNHLAAVVLIVVGGMRYSDVAEVMGTDRDTVASWRARGLTRVRELLTADSCHPEDVR